MMIIDRYVFRQSLTATIFVTLVLTALVFLIQCLKFLDLIVHSGASGLAIWGQTFLIIPGFFEVILPIGTVAGVLFVYNRLMVDNELIVLRALGFSPARLARSALVLSILLAGLLFVTMAWIAPIAKTEALAIRKEIKAQISALIFREGIFNEAGEGVMVYIRERDKEGNLLGLIIHDGREKTKSPTTIIAERGVLVTSDDGQQVVVYNGSRQEVSPDTGVLRILDFDRYIVDLPEEKERTTPRWQEPDERTFNNLLSQAQSGSGESLDNRLAFRNEIQKRILTPLLIPGFVIIGLSALLFGSYDRRGQTRRIIVAVALVVLLQVLFMGSYNLSRQSPLGFPLMLLTIILPFLAGSAALLWDRLTSGLDESKTSAEGHK